MDPEKQEFHAPGTRSTWFARVTAPFRADNRPPAASVADRRALLEELVALRAQDAADRERVVIRIASQRERVEQLREQLAAAERALYALEGEALSASGTHAVRLSR